MAPQPNLALHELAPKTHLSEAGFHPLDFWGRSIDIDIPRMSPSAAHALPFPIAHNRALDGLVQQYSGQIDHSFPAASVSITLSDQPFKRFTTPDVVTVSKFTRLVRGLVDQVTLPLMTDAGSLGLKVEIGQASDARWCGFVAGISPVPVFGHDRTSTLRETEAQALEILAARVRGGDVVANVFNVVSVGRTRNSELELDLARLLRIGDVDGVSVRYHNGTHVFVTARSNEARSRVIDTLINIETQRPELPLNYSVVTPDTARVVIPSDAYAIAA